MAIAQEHKDAPLPALRMGLAVAAAVTLHVAMLAGWQQDPAHALEPRFIDNGKIIDVIPSEASASLWALFGRKEATLRCNVSARGQLSDCRWVSEYAPGYGDRALAEIRHWRRIEDPALRGRSDVEFVVCVENCPYF